MIKVNVTARDIELANKKINDGCKSANCPIALSLKRTQKKRVSVLNASHITINYQNYFTISKDENRVNLFIESFDTGVKVKPISFFIKPL